MNELYQVKQVIMVPPRGFQFNSETSGSNLFQTQVELKSLDQVLVEFSNMVSILEKHKIKVLILEQDTSLPDAVFPNNWFSTHISSEGQHALIIYPMLTKNRQAEVNVEGLKRLLNDKDINIHDIIDLRNNENKVLEGTGSLVLDRNNKILYASLSVRTSTELVREVANFLNYKPILFHSTDTKNNLIYHTNVMMSIAKDYGVVCLQSIQDARQRTVVIDSLLESNKLIIDISQEQMKNMCGNVLELYNDKSESVLVLSETALSNFTKKQLKIIEDYSVLVPVAIPTIEKIGGGSARCMMAEVIFPTPCSSAFYAPASFQHY